MSKEFHICRTCGTEWLCRNWNKCKSFEITQCRCEECHPSGECEECKPISLGVKVVFT